MFSWIFSRPILSFISTVQDHQIVHSPPLRARLASSRPCQQAAATPRCRWRRAATTPPTPPQPPPSRDALPPSPRQLGIHHRGWAPTPLPRRRAPDRPCPRCLQCTVPQDQAATSTATHRPMVQASGQRESFFQSRDENESFSDSISFIETRLRISDTYSQASRRDREKISTNLGHRDKIEIYYLHSQASRREREFP